MIEGVCRAADLQPRQHARAISFRQRPPGARQACCTARFAAPMPDHLPRDRHPVVALVRESLGPARGRRSMSIRPRPRCAFRDPGLVRASIVRTLQDALGRDAQRAATTGRERQPSAAPERGRPSPQRAWGLAALAVRCRKAGARPAARAPPGFADAAHARLRGSAARRPTRAWSRSRRRPTPRPLWSIGRSARRAPQVHETYIVAQTPRRRGDRRSACRA